MPVAQWFGILATPGVMAVQTMLWSASDHNADITISGGQTIATRSALVSTFASARADTYNSSGKYYFEQDGSNDNFVVGIMTSATSLAGNAFPGSDTTGLCIDGPSGQWVFNGSLQGVITGTGAGRMCLAYDLDARKFWVARAAGNWNNSGAADPATGVGGVAFPVGMSAGAFTAAMTMTTSSPGATMTLIGSGALARSAPSGFLLQAPS